MNVTSIRKRLAFLTGIVLCFAGTALPNYADTPLNAIAPAQKTANAITLFSLGKDMGKRLIQEDYEEGVYRGRRVAGFEGKTGAISIDRETGIVVNYVERSHNSPASETDPPKLTSADALQIAQNFLSRSGVTLDGVWMLADNNYYYYGPSLADYELHWERMFNGIRLPSGIAMYIDANDGHVMRYSLIDDPVTIPLQVNVTGEQALAILAEKQGWQHPIMQYAGLAVGNVGGYPGPQAVVWRFKIVEYHPANGSGSVYWAEVNAATGEIVRFSGAAGGIRLPLKGKEPLSATLPKPNIKALRKAKAPPTVFQLAKMKKESSRTRLKPVEQ